MFQKINDLLDININNYILNLTNRYRYNNSNWLFNSASTPLTYSGDTDTISEFLLSTYTKRFMVLLCEYKNNTDSMDLYKVKVNCMINGDYQHSVTQTNGRGYKYVDFDPTNQKPRYLHWSYVIFDFTANEVKNSITVTDLNAVPTNGLFTLQFLDNEDKELIVLPKNQYMRFTMIGSGIDPNYITIPFFNTQITDTTFEFLRRLQTGEMQGYTRGRRQHNSIELNIGESGFKDYCTMQNIILPVSKRDLTASTTIAKLNVMYQTLIENGLHQNILNDVDKKILYLGKTPSSTTLYDIDIDYQNTDNVIQTEGNYRSSKNLLMMDYGKNFELNLRNQTNLLFPTNNMLLISQSYKQFDSLLNELSPLVLLQLSTLNVGTSAYKRVYDDTLSNVLFNWHNLSMKSLDYVLTYNVTSHLGDGDDTGSYNIWIKEIENQINMYQYNNDTQTSYDIEVKDWNSDTYHNVYIKFNS